MRIAVYGLPAPGRSPLALGWSTPEVAGLEAKLAGAAQLSRRQRVCPDTSKQSTALAISADGTRIVGGPRIETARVWDGAKRRAVA